MHENETESRLPPLVMQQMRSTAGSALLTAVLLLVFGVYFKQGGLRAAETTPAVYQWAVGAFAWVLLGGGTLMLFSSLFCVIGHRYALAADAIMTGLTGLGLALVGGLQVQYELRLGGFDINSVLTVVFGAVCLTSAGRSWSAHRRLTRILGQPVQPPEPVSPLPSPIPRARTGPSVSPMRPATPPIAPAAEPQGVTAPGIPPVTRTAHSVSTSSSSASQPPLDGFLAALGREDHSDRK